MHVDISSFFLETTKVLPVFLQGHHSIPQPLSLIVCGLAYFYCCSFVLDVRLNTLLLSLHRRMLSSYKKGHSCRRLGLGLVRHHRRPEIVAGGDDTQSDLRICRNCARCAPNCHGCRAVQNHEGRRASTNRQRTVLGKRRQRSKKHHSSDSRRPS